MRDYGKDVPQPRVQFAGSREQTKKCPHCERMLPLSDFAKTAQSKRYSLCHSCFAKRPNQPKPHYQCFACLRQLGYGYDRITAAFRLRNKKTVAEWFKRHKPDVTRPALKLKPAPIAKPPRAKKPAYVPRPKRTLEQILERRSIRETRSYLRGKLWQFLKYGLHPKSVSKMIGCDRSQFIEYLRPLLRNGMTFDNYGPVWHIDHRIPCKLFNLRDPSQRALCFHYTNLQPMFARDNVSKSASLPPLHELTAQLATIKALAIDTQPEFPFVTQNPMPALTLPLAKDGTQTGSGHAVPVPPRPSGAQEL